MVLLDVGISWLLVVNLASRVPVHADMIILVMLKLRKLSFLRNLEFFCGIHPEIQILLPIPPIEYNGMCGRMSFLISRICNVIIPHALIVQLNPISLEARDGLMTMMILKADEYLLSLVAGDWCSAKYANTYYKTSEFSVKILVLQTQRLYSWQAPHLKPVPASITLQWPLYRIRV